MFLAYNMNGICIIKKIVSMTHKKDLHNKSKIILKDNAISLIQHPYGNYIIQCAIDSWDEKDLN